MTWAIAEAVGREVLGYDRQLIGSLVEESQRRTVVADDGEEYEVSVEAWRYTRTPGRYEIQVVVTDGTMGSAFSPTTWQADIDFGEGS